MAGKILVLGATGTVGAHLVEELVRRGEKVKAASRNAAPGDLPGAEIVHLDLQEPAGIDAALDGVDRIFALSPTGYLDQAKLLFPVIDAAAARGVKVVLQTAIGVDASDAIPLRQAELRLERAGIPFVILRPNWFADNFVNYWLPSIRNGEIRLPAGTGKTSFIDARDIAAAAAGALTTNAFDGRIFVLTGPEALDYHQAAALLSSAAGKQILYRPVDAPTFVADMTAAGMPQDYAQFLATIYHAVAEGWTATVTDTVEQLSGRKPFSLARYVSDHAAAFAV